MSTVSTAPDLATLSRPDLLGFRSIVATVITRKDLFTARLRLFDTEGQAVLDGDRDEETLLQAIAAGVLNDAPPAAAAAASQ